MSVEDEEYGDVVGELTMSFAHNQVSLVQCICMHAS